MIYNLDERATLAEDGREAMRGTLREVIVEALSWDEPRLARAHILTVTQESYAPDMILEVARESGLSA